MRFDRSTPVWHLGPDPTPLRYRARAERVWVLWPAIAYRVIAPRPHARPFNLFEEFFLRLARTGVTASADVGRRLALGTDLAATIALKLLQTGMLGSDGTPTEQALKELDEAQLGSGEVVSGHVFQSPFTGNLWPRFWEERPQVAEVRRCHFDQQVKALRIDLNLGRPGQPDHVPSAALLPEQGCPWPDAPKAREILLACREHHLQARAHERACGRVTDLATCELDVEAGLDRVSGLGQPTEVFLTTYLFLPSVAPDMDRLGDWQVCDPFGLGPSLPLRKQIESLSGRFPLLTEVTDRLGNQVLVVSPTEFVEARRQLRQSAEVAVEQRFGPAVRGYQSLFTRLVEAEMLLGEVGNFAKARDSSLSRDRLKDFLLRAYSTLEELFALVHAQYPPGSGDLGTLAALSDVEAENGDLLARLATRFGFTDDEQEPFLPAFLRVSWRQAHGISRDQHRNVRAQFAVLVACANDLPGHPIRSLATGFPDCTRFLLTLKQMRDPGAHAGDMRRFEAPEVLHGHLCRCVRLLLPDLKEGAGPDAEPVVIAPWRRVQHVLRARASRTLERRFGANLRAYVRLYALALEMQTRVEEVQVAAGEPGVSDQEIALVSFLVKGAAALEAALQAVARSNPAQGDLPPLGPDRHENARAIRSTAESLGFEVGQDRAFADLITLPPQRIEHALQYGDGTLNAMTMALLWSASRDSSHPFHRLARNRPQLLLEVAEVSASRGHGDRPNVPVERVAPLAALILDLIEAFLDHIR